VFQGFSDIFCVGRMLICGEGDIYRVSFIGAAWAFTIVSGTLNFSSVERNPQIYAIRREKDAISPHS